MSFSHSDSTSEGILTDEKLERVFREIEEASERRALEEEEAASQPGPLDPVLSTLANMDLSRKRRRQSISISRVGSYSDVPAEVQQTASGPGSPVPWAPAPLYRTDTQTSAASTLSFTSSFTSGQTRHHEEENHTTQKETIVGRRNTLTKAMSTAFSKTLTRMRSRGAINEIGDSELVIDVAVHEATTETTIELADGQPQDGELRESTVPGPVPGPGSAVNFATLPRVETMAHIETKVEVGMAEGSDPGPSRRISISVDAPPKSEGSGFVSRSRSGSIGKLRGKLPLRSQASSADAKQAVEDTSGNSLPGTASSSKISDAVDGVAKDGEKEKSIGNRKASKRLSSFAKVLAQRLRRQKSGSESDKEKEKEKEKEKGRGKGRTKEKREGDKNSEKSSSKSSDNVITVKEVYMPPVSSISTAPAPVPPLSTPTQHPSEILDQPILKSPLLAAPPSIPNLKERLMAGLGGGNLPLSPSPRRSPSASDVPLPSSSAGSPRSPASSSSLSASVALSSEAAAPQISKEVLPEDPALIPLPASPVSPTFGAHPPPSSFDARASGSSFSGLGSGLEEGAGRGRRERLPPSALPDSDFGPVSRDPSVRSEDITPVEGSPLPSPTRSECGAAGGRVGGEGPEREIQEMYSVDSTKNSPVGAPKEVLVPAGGQLEQIPEVDVARTQTTQVPVPATS